MQASVYLQSMPLDGASHGMQRSAKRCSGMPSARLGHAYCQCGATPGLSSLLRSTCSSPLARANDACWRCVWRDSQRGGPGTAMLWSGRGADRASALDACLQVGTGSRDWDGDCDCCCVL